MTNIDCLMIGLWQRVLLALGVGVLWLALALPTSAAESDPHVSAISTARLVTAEDGIAPETKFISGALAISLEDDWKTYWRSPGEVGLPPEISWAGSENIASVEVQFPAPTRFRAFGIENFGYGEEVNFPLQVTLEDPGAPARLSAKVNILVCSEICVPEEFALDLSIGSGGGLDTGSATLIASAAALVPEPADLRGVSLTAAALDTDGTALVVALHRIGGWQGPDVFPEMGEFTAFGAPDIRVDPEEELLWARLPILSDPVTSPLPLRLTITDGEMAVDLPDVALTGAVPPPPFEAESATAKVSDLLWIALVAVLGGLILNVMPCVLPVLSIKFASALKASDQSMARVRGGFLMSAAGVLAFMWMLAAGTLAARAMGHSVGWGLQFQNPYFLTAMLLVLTVFAANLLGLFEISLPQGWMTRLSSEKGPGYTGDFATGAFAAVLATPCSAPFLGTAIAFAMAGRPLDIVVIFTALGLGLALPYLLVAIAPGLVRHLPKPGRWMVAVKAVLAALLLVTAAWLLWVLGGVAGQPALIWVAVLLGALVLLLSPAARRLGPAKTGLIAAAIIAAFFLPVSSDQVGDHETSALAESDWVTFERGEIPRRVAAGEVVFVDVTADWCLTCKANKALVLDREPVAGLLASEAVTAMRADWTRPNASISAYLESFGRFGIPFNAVYGPAAPEGIPLPELLTADIVQDALLRAGMPQVASAD